MSSNILGSLRFASRVQVWTSDRYLYKVHADRAKALIEAGEATPDTNGRIWRIRLKNIAPRYTSSPSRLIPRSYATKAAAFLEVLGHTDNGARLATYSFSKVDSQFPARILSEREASYIREPV